jgi:hypothetical protein
VRRIGRLFLAAIGAAALAAAPLAESVKLASAQAVPPTTPAPALTSTAPPSTDPPTAPASTAGSLTPATGKSVILRVNEIGLYAGGALTRTVAFDATKAVSLESIVAAVNDPAWAAQVAPGVFLLHAALVQAPGTALSIASPGVAELRLADQPGVFLGGTQAKASINHVHVESWDAATGGPETQDAQSRPFVLYERNSVLDVDSSQFSYLGYNDSPVEGVTWRTGTTGHAFSSMFDHCEIGALVSAAGQVTLTGDTFSDNVQDGVRLTQGSTKPVADSNKAIGNGGSGFVVDHNVVAADLERNTSSGNAGDGVAILSGSNQAVLSELTSSANKGNGVTVQKATGAHLTGVNASGNNIGVRLAQGSDQSVVSASSMTGNARAGLAVEQASGLHVTGVSVSGPGRAGMQLSAPSIQLLQSKVSGTVEGIDVLASAVLDHVSISDAQRGVVGKNKSVLTANFLLVNVSRVGLDLEAGVTATLTSSSVHARIPHRGGHVQSVSSSFSGSPFPWFVLFGLLLLVTAAVLEAIRAVRSRPFVGNALPPKVWNTT